MSALLSTLVSGWWSLAGRARRLARRPLLVHLGSLLRLVPLRPLEVNCLYFLAYKGIPPRPARPLRGPAEVRTATLDDLDGLTACQDRRTAFLERFRANDRCVVAVVDGRIVAYQWFCVRPLYREERYAYELEVPPDAVYEYDVYIRPEFRLSGIWFQFHCLYLAGLMEGQKRRRLIGMVDYGNRLAMNTHLRFGFRIFRRVFVVRLLGHSMFLARDLDDDRHARPGWISLPANGR